MPEMTAIAAIANVLQDDGTTFTEEVLRGFAEKDDRFEYEEETGTLFFTVTWGEAVPRDVSWGYVIEETQE